LAIELSISLGGFFAMANEHERFGLRRCALRNPYAAKAGGGYGGECEPSSRGAANV
jgi:hypothetical protein